MTRTQKLGIVAAGYAAAIVAGGLAGWAYDRSIPAAVRDASSGMYAFGQLLAAAAAFGVVALLPTALALAWMRGFVRLWRGLSVATVIFSATGVLATLLLVFSRGLHPPMALDLSLYAVVHMLGVPVWAIAIAILAALAPEPASRRRFIVAVGLEVVIAVCAVVHFAGAYTNH